MGDFDEALRRAEQFATYWYGDRATVTRMEQRDPIALKPLASLDLPPGDAPGDETASAYAWTAIVHPPQGFAVRIALVQTPSGWYGIPVGQIAE